MNDELADQIKGMLIKPVKYMSSGSLLLAVLFIGLFLLLWFMRGVLNCCSGLVKKLQRRVKETDGDELSTETSILEEKTEVKLNDQQPQAAINNYTSQPTRTIIVPVTPPVQTAPTVEVTITDALIRALTSHINQVNGVSIKRLDSLTRNDRLETPPRNLRLVMDGAHHMPQQRIWSPPYVISNGLDDNGYYGRRESHMSLRSFGNNYNNSHLNDHSRLPQVFMRRISVAPTPPNSRMDTVPNGMPYGQMNGMLTGQHQHQMQRTMNHVMGTGQFVSHTNGGNGNNRIYPQIVPPEDPGENDDSGRGGSNPEIIVSNGQDADEAGIEREEEMPHQHQPDHNGKPEGKKTHLDSCDIT